MKNIFIYIVALIAVAACQREDDPLLMGRPEERVEQILKDYRQQLVDAPSGWKGYLFPGSGGGYSFYMTFSTEGRVTMLADINADCQVKPFESSFRMEAVQRPSLFFDTYSYLHILSDPDPDTVGGAQGHGLNSDFEFAFESTQGDTIKLKGNQHGSPLLLIKATAAESEALRRGDLSVLQKGVVGYKDKNPFTYLQSRDGKRINTSFNLDAKTFSLSFKQADSLNIQTTPFAYTTNGIFLQKQITYKDVTFREVSYDASGKFYVMVGGERINLVPSADPILPLHLLLGIDFTTVSVPFEPLPGWSPLYTNLRLTIHNALLAKGVGLSNIELAFNPKNKTLTLDVFMRAVGDGGYYLGRYQYAYTKSADGVFKFTRYEEPTGNAKYIEEDMAPFLYYFNSSRFRMEYLKTDDGFVAQLKCVESPTFYFSGNFGSAF